LLEAVVVVVLGRARVRLAAEVLVVY